MPKGEPIPDSTYTMYRMFYRDLEQRRADIFYAIERHRRNISELTDELASIDNALTHYGAEIKRFEDNKGGR